MAFIEDIVFPVRISKGSSGGPGHNHSIFSSDSGEQNTINRWPKPRRMWNARAGVRSDDHLRQIHDLYLVVEGISNGFRWEDIRDFTTAADGKSAHTPFDAVLGQGDGSRVLFQLLKTYSVPGSSRTHTRVIEKPNNIVAGSVRVAVDGIELVEGVGFTVDYSSGEILLAVAPTLAQTVTAGCRFHVPVQFGATIDQLLDTSFDGAQHGGIQNIPIVEMVGNTVTPAQPFRGEGTTQLIDINTTYDYNFGHSVAWVPSTSGLFVVLPEIEDLANGLPLFHFENGSATESLDFRRRETGALEFTLAPQGNPLSSALVGIRLTGVSTKNWYALGGAA